MRADLRKIKYCERCGTELVCVKRFVHDYDARTGESNVVEKRKCPKRWPFPWLHTAVFNNVSTGKGEWS